MHAGSSLTEEGVEGIVSTSDGLVTGHLTVRLYTVFHTVQLPACIAHLDSSLADMYRDTLTLWGEKQQEKLYTWYSHCLHLKKPFSHWGKSPTFLNEVLFRIRICQWWVCVDKKTRFEVKMMQF
jgi:hypothetical protein